MKLRPRLFGGRWGRLLTAIGLPAKRQGEGKVRPGHASRRPFRSPKSDLKPASSSGPIYHFHSPAQPSTERRSRVLQVQRQRGRV
jgi:hypothetical protein